MSADLLRHAADELRKHVGGLPATMTGPWYTRSDRVIADDGTDVGMLVVEPYNPADDHSLMKHIARTASPPVALALAATLEHLAEAINGTVGDAAATDIFAAEIALARTILREALDA